MVSGPPSAAGDPTSRQETVRRRVLAVLVVAAVWLAMRVVFWVGFVGADDLVYTYYAHTFDRAPLDHREFRIPAVLAFRAAMAVLGPTEVAACLPTLTASLAVAAAAAWLVGWPARAGPRQTATMLLVSMIPADVAFASYPAAPQLAAGLLALATATVLRGGRAAVAVGPVLFAAAFMTHEVSVFYIAIFLAVGVVGDRARFLRPAVATALLSAAALAVEAGIYHGVLGDWLARWRVASVEIDHTHLDPLRFAGDPAGFFLWPLRALVLSKHFGLDLLLLFGLGAASWRRLDASGRVLVATGLVLWLWLGYGSQVPWAYRPRTRSFHYYLPLVLPIAVVLPGLLADLLRRRRRWFGLSVAGVLGLHLLSLGAGGRWGQTVEVSRHLLRHARANPGTRFLADIHTFNEMTCLNGFSPPANVTWVPSALAADKILVRRGHPAAEAPPVERVEAILVNFEDSGGRPDEAFRSFLAVSRGPVLWRLPARTKPMLRPLVGVLGARPIAVLSRGGEVVAVSRGDGAARPPG